MHCFEIVAYRHPDLLVRAPCLAIYTKLVRNLHLNPETSDQMIARLGEDRIATGNVVQ